MRRQIVETAKGGGSKAANLLRESLQWEILAAMHGVEAFREVVFVGGTCLRLMHGLKRFSEDLDFSAQSRRGAFFGGLPKAVGEFFGIARFWRCGSGRRKNAWCGSLAVGEVSRCAERGRSLADVFAEGRNQVGV